MGMDRALGVLYAGTAKAGVRPNQFRSRVNDIQCLGVLVVLTLFDTRVGDIDTFVVIRNIENPECAKAKFRAFRLAETNVSNIQ